MIWRTVCGESRTYGSERAVNEQSFRGYSTKLHMGYVYILVNTSMPGLIKVGKTERDCQKRAKEISEATGVPTPFAVAYTLFSEEYERLEDEIHRVLREYRVNPKREFFRCPVDAAVDILKALHAGESLSKVGMLKALHAANPLTNESLFSTLNRQLKDPRKRDGAVSMLFSYIDKYQDSFDAAIKLLIYIVNSANWSDKSYKVQKAVTCLRRTHSPEIMQTIQEYDERINLKRAKEKMGKSIGRKGAIAGLLTWFRSRIGLFLF